MRKLIYLFVIINFSLSCKSKEKVPASATATAAATDTVLLASIERTPCFGRCPTYKITIYQSGYVVMDGKQNVKNIGMFSTRLNKTQVEEIKSYIIEKKIYDLQDKHVNPHIVDFPSTFAEINLNGKYKHITNTEPQAPQQLIDFEKYLDSFFTDETKWELISELK